MIDMMAIAARDGRSRAALLSVVDRNAAIDVAAVVLLVLGPEFEDTAGFDPDIAKIDDFVAKLNIAFHHIFLSQMHDHYESQK